MPNSKGDRYYNISGAHEKGTIYFSELKQRKTYNKRVRVIFRIKRPQKARLFGFCWYILFRLSKSWSARDEDLFSVEVVLLTMLIIVRKRLHY